MWLAWRQPEGERGERSGNRADQKDATWRVHYEEAGMEREDQWSNYCHPGKRQCGLDQVCTVEVQEMHR